MTITRGFAITIASGIAFGAIGTLAGYALGVIAPDSPPGEGDRSAQGSKLE